MSQGAYFLTKQHCNYFLDIDKKLLEELQFLQNGVSALGHSDVYGSILALARIQIFYNLDPYDLARGIIAGKVTKARMSPVGMVVLARTLVGGKVKFSINSGPSYACALQWLEAAERWDLIFYFKSFFTVSSYFNRINTEQNGELHRDTRRIQSIYTDVVKMVSGKMLSLFIYSI